MSICLTATGLCLRTPDHHTLLDGLDFTLGSEVVGLVGANGAGKSTLLRALAGDVLPAAGTVSISGRLAWLAQLGADAAGNVADGLGIADGLARLDRILAGEPEGDDLELADWTLPAEADAALGRFGLEGLGLNHRLDQLSGGQQARVALAGAWLSKPDILLMDEPTNNLDRAGRDAVYQLMADWPGAILVASHDRELLEHVDRILALESTGWRIFGGGWTAYAADREAREVEAEAAFNRAKARVRSVERAGEEAEARLARRARSGKAKARDGSQPKMVANAMKSQSEATAARQSSQTERQLEQARSTLADADSQRSRAPKLSVKPPDATATRGRIQLSFEEVSFNYVDRAVIEGLSFTVMGGERVAVEGPNGSGKTTLLKLAMGELKPSGGEVRRGAGRVARLDQMVGDLSPDLSAVEALRARHPELTENAARSALAQFDIRGRMGDRRVESLSGGERLRVGLAGVLGGEPPELLLMDEPTNHLDIQAVEALEQALKAYRGTILAVSHDRAFLEAIGIERSLQLMPLKL